MVAGGQSDAGRWLRHGQSQCEGEADRIWIAYLSALPRVRCDRRRAPHQHLRKTGQVSYEFRNYVRDAFDLTASLIARCNGAKGFFPLARAFYADQPNWEGKIQTIPQDQAQALQNLPPNQQFLKIAQLLSLQDWAAARGLPPAKTAQCLTNENSVNQLVQMNSDATTQFPDFQGTPTFIINGKMVSIQAGQSPCGIS